MQAMGKIILCRGIQGSGKIGVEVMEGIQSVSNITEFIVD